VKLLFDQNLSPELVNRLADLFPGSEHVANIGMGGSADDEIAAHAKSAGFTVVTRILISSHILAALWNVRLSGFGCRTAALVKGTACCGVLRFVFAISVMIRI
jgi:hypothetical protein